MKSGFVALAGRPNAGKSTLINNLVGEKVAIVSSKPQTTRSEIRGIYTDEDCQIVFTDTPGIHKAKLRLETRMNKEASDVMHDVDLIYLVIDGSQKYGPGDAYVLEMVRNTHLSVFLILNKIDKMDRAKVAEVLQSWQGTVCIRRILSHQCTVRKDFSGSDPYNGKVSAGRRTDVSCRNDQ